ncbi:uncharacterized protein LY89DRAFT_679662 [Mollisia scopiformis]|uniref:Zn(2)-C6 fungal-type domain-containing protein n=1 Tax=Mollisia scopiformis TaxID=149040 RepID=A0A194XWP3_MOLSC|nr:uncharacterized protein LY89DRAFT_679662 [Mollisia scopiformis]KUJ24551.1 hypothetical protein LY89DRAFT_679662 [Mollisia scopiformis]
MNSITNEFVSGRPSPRDNADNLSMFFDFGTPNQNQNPSDSMRVLSIGQGQEPVQRGGIRVSLACVPCRSRHVKCGAEMPNCSRCLQDDKPCFYAKSRRGMRDRNVPRKRASLREAGKGSPGSSSSTAQSLPSHNSRELHRAASSTESYHAASDASDSPSSSSPRPRPSHKVPSPRRLLELYYSSFHKAHPFLLPRYYFLSRLQSDPESLKHLLPIMHYLGSLFLPDMASSELRAAALREIELVNLPPNGFTVQALLLTAIAVHSQDELVHARAILDKAIYLALDLRMNSRTFANMERDPVMAESWRRTYWFLYMTDALFAAIRRAPNFLLFTVDATVELPCEECDYDGIIPRPRTLDEYEARDFEDEEVVFSSFTYLIDLTRITGAILGFDHFPRKEMEIAVNNADAMLVNWKLHLPKEKQSVIDKNEEVDEILFQAQNLLQILLVFIHRPLSRLFHSPIEKISQCAPPPMPHQMTGEEDKTYWLHTKKTLEAAEAAINLYALPCPIINHTPLGICGLALSTLANLSACAYVLNGVEWYRTRDRIRLGLGGLKAMGEIWQISKRTETEVKQIARSVFAMARPQDAKNIDNAFAFQGIETSTITPDIQALDVGWEELGQLEYFNTWDGMSGSGMNGISI